MINGTAELYPLQTVPVIGGGLCAIVRFSSGDITFFRSDSSTVGWQTRILQVYTQRFRASKVLQYTREHLEEIGFSSTTLLDFSR